MLVPHRAAGRLTVLTGFTACSVDVDGDTVRSVTVALGALLPVRMRNLLPACKNAGTTHVANGYLRLHPVEWNVGEVAVLPAAFCVREGREPHQVYANRSLPEQFTALLDRKGVERRLPFPPPQQQPRSPLA